MNHASPVRYEYCQSKILRSILSTLHVELPTSNVPEALPTMHERIETRQCCGRPSVHFVISLARSMNRDSRLTYRPSYRETIPDLKNEEEFLVPGPVQVYASPRIQSNFTDGSVENLASTHMLTYASAILPFHHLPLTDLRR